MKRTITVTESVSIEQPPEVVFDYTQDWSRRTEWDRAILQAEYLEREPSPTVRVRTRGGLAFEAQYKLFCRPSKTSMAFVKTSSWIFSGGGGSWAYEQVGNGTRFTETNALTVRSPLMRWLLGRVVRWQLARETRAARVSARSSRDRGAIERRRARPL